MEFQTWKILQRKGPLSYEVQVGYRQVKVHLDHLLPSKGSRSSSTGDILDYLTGCEVKKQEAQLKKMFQLVAEEEWRYPERQWTAPKRLDL